MSVTIVNEDEIKLAGDLVKIIGEYVKLKHKGKNYFGACPFHNEHTPSFVVSPAKGIYKCFGCGESGDAIKFVMKQEHLGYRDALLWIADYSGVTPVMSDQTEVTYRRLPSRKTIAPVVPLPPSYLSWSDVIDTIFSCRDNYFIDFLIRHFGLACYHDIRQRYLIGTSKYKTGASIFYQEDGHCKIRGGKIMVYDPVSGKRRRDVDIKWCHTVAQLKGYHLQQCFYGQLLLSRDPDKPVLIVESEKSAIIASLYLPEYVCLATGGKNNGVIANNISVLAGRDVMLLPDLGATRVKQTDGTYKEVTAYEEWQALAVDLEGVVNRVVVSDLLEKKATAEERAAKLDVADYLLRIPYHDVLTDRFLHEILAGLPVERQRERAIHYRLLGLSQGDIEGVAGVLVERYGFEYEGGDRHCVEQAKLF